MKKKLSLLLALLLTLSLTACLAGLAMAEEGPVAEEVRGVTIPAFSILVNGVEITQEAVAAYPMYSVQAKSVNSTGTESIVTYVGFAIKDVLDAAGLSEAYVWMEAVAGDGYAVQITGDAIYEDTTLLAMTKDGAPFSASPWLAPCSNTVTSNYLKGAEVILVNTTEGAPDLTLPESGASQAESAAVDALPEILDRTDKVEFAPFSFVVNGEEIANEKLAGLSIYKITAVTTNKSGDVVESGYTGYKLTDVLEACGLDDCTSVKAIANDGYETELSSELIQSDYTLVAIEKDKELGEDGTIWLAPCSEGAANAYCKLVVEIVAK